VNARPSLVCGSLFSGIGMLDFGLFLAGFEHAWFCESEPWRRERLEQRFPGISVSDDIRAVGAASARPVDVIAGGFPCKGASTAGKRGGFEHPETVLWREMRRAIGELRPRYVIVENVANLLALHRGELWGEVLGDLDALGFDVVWDCLPAAAVGAPHRRDRVFAVACRTDAAGPQVAAHSDGEGRQAGRVAESSLGGVGGSGRGRERGTAGTEAPADPRRDGVRQQPEPEPGRGGASESGRSGEAAPHPASLSRQGARDERQALVGAAPDRGIAVDWGDFEAAVRRWESAFRPAPEPLVRRVDDGATRRMERSRLSALGDGVQVQVGLLVGRYVVERERERLMASTETEGVV
jgi:DNA (cytosine-5)-methyltransferase 1